MRIALACSGLGIVNRGYEASVLELYDALRERLAVVLYRGGAGQPGTRCRTIARNSSLYHLRPFDRTPSYRRYVVENAGFVIGLASRLLGDGADILFTPDHVVATWINRIQSSFERFPTVIFSNGAPFKNDFCARFRFVHQKSFEHFQAGEAQETRMFLIPNGFDPARLVEPEEFDRNSERARFGLPRDETVILCLSALNVQHKRLDWILNELAGIADSCFLIFCGDDCGETAELRARAASLRIRSKFMTVSYSEVPNLIWSCDLMVLGSISEGFPRVMAEAMGAKRHIFVHGHDNARWILNNNEKCLVDMTRHGALADAVARWRNRREEYNESIERNFDWFLRTYSWSAVTEQYIKMFETVFDASDRWS